MSISGTLRAKEKRDACLAKGEKVLDGGLGESPVGPMPHLRELVVDEVRQNHNYTSCHGSNKMQALLGTHRVVTGNALKELLCMIQLAFLKTHPDGIIVYLVPHWPTYAEQARAFNIPFHRVRPTDTATYKVTKGDLLGDQVLRSHRHLVFFNNPCNPSGSVYSSEEMRELACAFKALHSIVLADNIYAELAHAGCVESMSEYYPKTVDTTSLSKTLGCGGWRYGWAKFPPCLDDLFKQTKVMASTLYTCPSSCFAKLAEQMIERPPEIESHLCMVRDMLRTTFEKCILSTLEKTKIKFTLCEGAWYTLLDFSEYRFELASQGITTSKTLVHALFEDHNIIMVEGSEFGFEESELILRYSFVDMDVKFEYGTIGWDSIRITELCLELQKFCFMLVC